MSDSQKLIPPTIILVSKVLLDVNVALLKQKSTLLFMCQGESVAGHAGPGELPLRAHNRTALLKFLHVCSGFG